ncbi:terpenoid synthase [Earliella scabrosa]|nr:terpenoid synthase [Earliella scabrosa]
MSAQPRIVYLPDTFSYWPWPRRLNPHYKEVEGPSAAWLESFGAFSPQAQEAFNKCKISLFVSLVYPDANKDELRAECDLMNLFFLFDEYSDVEYEKTVQEFARIVMDALRNPHKPRPAGESLLGEVSRQFWERAIRVASEPSQRRFIKTFESYCQAVVQQAADRDKKHIRDVDSYFENRRENIGTKPCFAFLELDMNIPDAVMEHPTIVNLTNWATDIIIMDNDIFSYNVEQARGDDRHNLTTIIMHQFNVDVQEAFDKIGKWRQELTDQFLEAYGKLPSWGPEIDEEVRRYVDGMGNWVRGNIAWSFESERYFGLDGPEIEKTRRVVLRPQVPEALP